SVQHGRAPASYRGRCLPGRRQTSTPPGATLAEGLPPARYPVPDTGGSSGLGGSPPSPPSFVPAWSSGRRAAVRVRGGTVAERRGARLQSATRRFESAQCLLAEEK